MATPITVVESQHQDMIHDSQFDYYGKRLATCSSDRTIKIYELSGEVCLPQFTITTHEGPVWQVSWAHPRFGTLLASCSYDGSVHIHREMTQNSWVKIFEHKVYDASINSVCWAPHEYGLLLAAASSDGKITILEYKNDAWLQTSFVNDSLGCNAVSWAPYTALGSQTAEGGHLLRLVTGSCDNTVRVWKFEGHWENNMTGEWVEERKTGNAHTDWVRDVAWAPNTAMPYNIIASCSEDRSVRIWKQTEAGGLWQASVMKTFDSPVWRVSWSVTGNVLAVSSGDHKVSLWKMNVDETWLQLTNVEDHNGSM